MVLFWQTITDAYRLSFRDIQQVSRLLWKPLIYGFALSFIVGFVDGFLRLENMLSATLGIYISLIFGGFFALAVHRMRLFGWSDTTSKVSFKVDAAARTFLLFVTVYFVVFMLLPLIMRDMAGGYGLIIAAGIAFASIPLFLATSLALPAAAAGRSAPLGYSLQLMRGIFWRSAGILVVCTLPITIGALLLRTSFIEYPLIAPLSFGVLAYYLSVVSITAVCNIYKIRSAQIGDV